MISKSYNFYKNYEFRRRTDSFSYDKECIIFEK